jgi:hypothetical protein
VHYRVKDLVVFSGTSMRQKRHPQCRRPVRQQDHPQY